MQTNSIIKQPLRSTQLNTLSCLLSGLQELHNLTAPMTTHIQSNKHFNHTKLHNSTPTQIILSTQHVCLPSGLQRLTIFDASNDSSYSPTILAYLELYKPNKSYISSVSLTQNNKRAFVGHPFISRPQTHDQLELNQKVSSQHVCRVLQHARSMFTRLPHTEINDKT